MKEDNKYYTPSLEEFKQGFKFEVLRFRKGEKTVGVLFHGFPNKKNGVEWHYAEEDEWEEMEVWWDREPQLRTVEMGNGNTLSAMESEWDLQPKSFNLIRYLKDGRIRAKKSS